MNEMDLMTPDEVIEERFKSFIKRLLEAQSYDFMKEEALFSPITLERTLEGFCNIIADELDCDSCTIQLQMYDSKMMDEKLLNKLIYDNLFKTSKSYIKMMIKPIYNRKGIKLDILLKAWLKIELSNKEIKNNFGKNLNKIINRHLMKENRRQYKNKIVDYLREFKKSRINWLKSPLVFPYWAYGKGVAGSVAANNTSPWLTLFKDKNNALKYVTLFGGVSKTIFQENVARVRDRLSIRGTRNFRKLGAADMIVWNNTSWKYVFKNFYGIPIRIHSGGEVIGILRAENKWTHGKEEEKKLIANLLKAGSSGEFINGIIKKIDEKFKECKDLEKLNVSLLSLVYLEKDLKSDECKEIVNKKCGLEELIFLPYPENEHIISKLGGEIYERINKDLLGNKNNIENPKGFLDKEVGEENNQWEELFLKKKLLCEIFRNFIADFYYCDAEIKELEQGLQFIEGLNKSDSEISNFKTQVRNILKKFDKKIGSIINRRINSLMPVGKKKSPPMQLFTINMADEKELWNLLKEDGDCNRLYKKIKEFYVVFEDYIYQNIDYKKGKLSLEENEKSIFAEKINGIIPKRTHVRVKSIDTEDWNKLKLPDFHFKVSLSYVLLEEKKEDFKDLHTFDFYMVILPTRLEIKKGIEKYIPDVGKYKEVNNIWLSEKGCTVEEFCKRRQKLGGKPQGEFIIFNDSKENIKVTDLIIDRLAARIQAFAHALPLAEFLNEDTYKLKWAAFEIGKLIEREISYRANRHDDPMPLTAMEFYRIPISDLSFVDDLRIRRDDLKKAADNIDVYIKNTISQMEMTDSVKYSSRIKGYRSSLQRIGERFEGYVRGNLAIWLFLLYFFLNSDEKSYKEKFGNNSKLKEKEGMNGKKVNQGMVFIQHLKKFGKSIVESQDAAGFFDEFFKNNNSKTLYGDAKFDSPPFMDEQKNCRNDLIDAFNRIRANLESEGIYRGKFSDIDNKTNIDTYFSNNKGPYNDLLLRNYSYFIRDSLSLLVQIANRLNSLNNNKIKKFKEFYKKCRELRDFLCSSLREMESKEKYKLEKIFGLQEKPDKGASWRKIKEFIDKYNTGSVFPDDDDNYLKLTPKSIYKRIRMLNNILNHQIPAAHLDWELGRFDLYGTRMNCLFKNQVFVLYEKIWNRGDPFFFYDPRAKEFKKYYNEEEKIDTNKYRQRWICLRTNILAGEYNACQIAALIDPKTVEPEYWEYISSYNLKCAQYVLGKIFNEFEGTIAEKYRFYSWHRHLISDCYRKWYQFRSNLLKRETQNGDKEQEDTKWYGSFLFASVINLLMLMLNCIIDKKNNENKKNPNGSKNDNLNKGIKNRHGFSDKTIRNIVLEMEKDITSKNLFFKIINAFYWIIKNVSSYQSSYSNCIKEGFMKEELFSRKQFHCRCSKYHLKKNIKKTPDKLLVICEKNDTENCNLYKMAIKIVENIIKNCSTANSRESRDKEIFEKIKESLEKEKAFFTELRVSPDIEGFQIPIFFFDENQKDSAGQRTLDNLKEICDKLQGKLSSGEGDKIKVNYWDFIYITLKRIRREQRAYLFDKGEKEKNYAGLWMREKTEMLNRIKNYVLLFSEKDIDKKNKSLFRGWNAHDFYYYIRSLIPMEIQVRTELANTFAVQYHDDIYKVQTPLGTEFPHAMMKRAGETLDRTDKELEIDYEDYILKYHHRVEEEEEEEED